MNDEPTVIRQWRMLGMLGVRRHGIVVSDMAREFGVDARTIRRDLQKLQLVGFPIRETTGKREARSGASPIRRSSRPWHSRSTKRSYSTSLGLSSRPCAGPCSGRPPTAPCARSRRR